MLVYLVLVNGRVSSEAYSTLEKAQKFIEYRTGKPLEDTDHSYGMGTKGEYIYEIRDVRVV